MGYLCIMGNIFEFKQFSVNQEGCAMRINTDGVLLGAMTDHSNVSSVLDIGTGTGVIALMMAQKFPNAHVYAVEIDKQASERAKENFENSSFSERLTIINSDIFQWKNDMRFDLIVSNPPFYINSLHNPDQRRKVAKHTDVEFFQGMFKFAADQLEQHGTLQIIVPVELLDKLIEEGKSNGLHLQKQIDIQSFTDSQPFRSILSFGRENLKMVQNNFIIYKERSQHSDSYKNILKPYFLAF
jgi:tRNA1Val (adenine37-N6)-methyltransferase